MWEPTHPRAAPELLAGLTCPWWIAGGWALDLFSGRQSRPHRDLDVGILRRDAPRVIAALPDWEFFRGAGRHAAPPRESRARTAGELALVPAAGCVPLGARAAAR